MKKKLLLISFMLTSLLSTASASDRIYIDQAEMTSDEDAFHVHIGGNMWIETDTVHRDATGLYTHEGNITLQYNPLTNRAEYEKKWKCPYCHQYWPVGKPCQNKDCPSKYKTVK